jgi:hypothetical protein
VKLAAKKKGTPAVAAAGRASCSGQRSKPLIRANVSGNRRMAITGPRASVRALHALRQSRHRRAEIMSTPPKIAIRERFTSEDVQCEIEIHELEHGYKGVWRCECGQTGESESSYPHTTAATIWARGACQRHHQDAH